MKIYRITKYNPKLRDKMGRYLIDDWTSMSDIGKTFSGKELTLKKYLEVERQYLDVIEMLLNDNNVVQVKITNLEKYKGFECLSAKEKEIIDNIWVDKCVGVNEITLICKLILREFIWAEFEWINTKMMLKFGYDYYMYFVCDEIRKELIDKICSCGLFVEDIGRDTVDA